MLVVATVPLAVFVAGLVLYLATDHAKLMEIGRAMLWCGLLVALLVVKGAVVSLGGR